MGVISLTTGFSRASRHEHDEHEVTLQDQGPNLLTAARINLGLSPEAVAKELNLSPAQITAIEDGDHSDFAGLVYLKGYIRNYARFVGVNPEAALGHLVDERGDKVAIVMPGAKRFQATPRRGSRRAGRIIFPLMLLLLGAFVLGAGYLVFQSQWGADDGGNAVPLIPKSSAIKSTAAPKGGGVKLEVVTEPTAAGSAQSSSSPTRRTFGIPIVDQAISERHTGKQTPEKSAAEDTSDKSPPVEDTSPPATEKKKTSSLQLPSVDSPTPATVTAPVSDTQLSASDNTPEANTLDVSEQITALSDTIVVAGESASSEALATSITTDAPLTIETVPGTGKSGLVLSGNAESWVEIRDSDNIELFAANLEAGQIVEFQSAPPFTIVVGVADAVDVTHAGAKINVAEYAVKNVSRFTIDSKGAVAAAPQ